MVVVYLIQAQAHHVGNGKHFGQAAKIYLKVFAAFILIMYKHQSQSPGKKWPHKWPVIQDVQLEVTQELWANSTVNMHGIPQGWLAAQINMLVLITAK